MTATPSWYLSISITLIVLSGIVRFVSTARSEEHTSELQSQSNLVCRLLLEKKKTQRHKDTKAQRKPVISKSFDAGFLCAFAFLCLGIDYSSSSYSLFSPFLACFSFALSARS